MTTVREIMSTELVTIDPAATLMDAAAVMSKGEAGSALVFRGDRLIGIFTERDIMRALAHYPMADEARVSAVERWMTADPVTIGPGATVGDALDRMLAGGFRHLPVHDGATVVGVISMRDLAKSTAKER